MDCVVCVTVTVGWREEGWVVEEQIWRVTPTYYNQPLHTTSNITTVSQRINLYKAGIEDITVEGGVESHLGQVCCDTIYGVPELIFFSKYVFALFIYVPNSNSVQKPVEIKNSYVEKQNGSCTGDVCVF